LNQLSKKEIEARFFSKMKDEADLEIRRGETSRVIVFVPRHFSLAVPF